MPTTVYQRIGRFEKRTGFKFSAYQTQCIGHRLRDLWKIRPNNPWLNKVQSIEKRGTFTVFEYPYDFIPIIDQLLRNVRKEIIEQAHRRRLQQFPPWMILQPFVLELIVEPPLPAPKVRKRILSKSTKNIPVWRSKTNAIDG